MTYNCYCFYIYKFVYLFRKSDVVTMQITGNLTTAFDILVGILTALNKKT
jgi:hypothetical protein